MGTAPNCFAAADTQPGPQATSKTNISDETLASSKSEGMNCRVRGDHTESYLSATRCQPSCSNRAKSSSISDVIVGQALSPANVVSNRSGCPTILLERQFDSFFFFARYEFVSLNDTRAGVPPQNRIIVTGWAERFSFFEPFHCFAQKIVRLKSAARSVLPQFRLCPAFGDDSGIIRALIFRFHAAQQFFRLRLADAIRFFEAIGECEQKRDNSPLVIGIDSKNIETDTLRFAGFVKQTVPLSLLQRGGNSVFVELFQFGHGDL